MLKLEIDRYVQTMYNILILGLLQKLIDLYRQRIMYIFYNYNDAPSRTLYSYILIR